MDTTPSDIIAMLHSAVDSLAQLDPSDLTTAELGDVAVELQQLRHKMEGVSARILRRWHDSGVWSLDGSRSSATHLARETKSSAASCRRDLRRARATADLPAVTQAIVEGDLSIDHLDLFAATRTTARGPAMDRDQQQLVNHCRTLNFADARTLLAYWAQAHDASLAPDHTTTPAEPSRLFLSETLGGTWRLDGTLEPLTGGIVAKELHRLERLIHDRDAAAGIVRTPAQRRADALLEMAQRSADRSDPGRTARPLFTVVVGQDAFRRVCELAEGTVISPEQLVPWLGNADYETILFDGPHTVISVSRQRRFTGALRRAIEVRDRRCTHPSDCDVPASRCDVDHIVPYAQRGPTSQFNGRLQCATHNRNEMRHATSPTRPMPFRAVTELDHIRGRLRYQYLAESGDESDHPVTAGRR